MTGPDREVEDEEYDTVICVGTLAIVHAPKESLLQLPKAIRPYGHIVFTLRPDILEKHGGIRSKDRRRGDRELPSPPSGRTRSSTQGLGLQKVALARTNHSYNFPVSRHIMRFKNLSAITAKQNERGYRTCLIFIPEFPSECSMNVDSYYDAGIAESVF